MIEISVKDGAAFNSKIVNLSGKNYRVYFNFNSTDKRWRFGLGDSEGNEIIRGKIITPYESLTKKYSFDQLSKGNFWCFPKTSKPSNLGFDNLGFDKDYGIFFLTLEEEKEYGL